MNAPPITAGGRATGSPMEALLLEALRGQPRFVPAYDLVELASRSLGRRVAPTTVYRALDRLVAAGIVRHLVSAQGFVARADPEAPEGGVLLVCKTCRTVSEARAAAVVPSLTAAAEAAGFAAIGYPVEVLGTCSDCSTPKPPHGT